MGVLDVGIFPFGARTALQVVRKKAQPLNYPVLSMYGNLISLYWGGDGAGAIVKRWACLLFTLCLWVQAVCAGVPLTYSLSLSQSFRTMEKRPVFKRNRAISERLPKNVRAQYIIALPAPPTHSPQPHPLCATDTPAQSMLCLSAHIVCSVHLVKPCNATQCSQAPCS